MALNILGFLAAVLIATAEGLAPNRLRAATVLFVTALLLLVAAFHASYFILAMLLGVGGSLLGIVLHRFPAHKETSDTPHGTSSVHKVVPVLLAGLIHLLGIWLLPIVVVWNLADAWQNGFPRFFDQEMGHVLPATFYFSILILTPLLLLPRGYYKGTLVHQSLEGMAIAIFGLVDFVVFRLSHHMMGMGDPPNIAAAAWDHELLGLLWCAGGLTGWLTARHGYATSAHVAFPALVICYNMLNHSHHSTAGADAESTEKNSWQMVWMSMHKIHALCFGLGALCRLWRRIPESLLFFYLGCVTFVFSSYEVTMWLFDVFNYTKDKDSGWSPDCDPNCVVNYPTDHVAMIVVLTLGALQFPLHLALCEQLRSFTEQLAPTAFAELPTSDMLDGGDMLGGDEYDDDDGYKDVNGGRTTREIQNGTLLNHSTGDENGLSIL